jgi:type I restriction enzyme S subunit
MSELDCQPNRLNELIADFCPDGVEYKTLDHICVFETGTQLNKDKIFEAGLYPVMNGGIAPSGYWNEYNTEANTITISQGGASAGYVNFITNRFWCGAHCYTTKLITDKIIYKFLYYFIKNNEYKLMNSKKGAGIPGLNKKEIYSLKIPLPPLPVQQEIVRILDNFTELTTELTAELTARQKQYEYYRDKLLTFGDEVPVFLKKLIVDLCPDGVKYAKIKEVYKRLKGTPITAGKMKEIDNPKGEIRIFAGGKTVINAKECDIPKANITRVPAVLVQSRGIIDAIYYDKPFTFKNEMWAYTADSKIEVKYLYYVLKSNLSHFREKASGMGSLPQISLRVTEEFIIPLPPLPVQREIVRILDNFTELITELTAELTARQKQYEYYRDKLLSFKEMKS